MYRKERANARQDDVYADDDAESVDSYGSPLICTTIAAISPLSRLYGLLKEYISDSSPYSLPYADIANMLYTIAWQEGYSAKLKSLARCNRHKGSEEEIKCRSRSCYACCPGHDWSHQRHVKEVARYHDFTHFSTFTFQTVPSISYSALHGMASEARQALTDKFTKRGQLKTLGLTGYWLEEQQRYDPEQGHFNVHYHCIYTSSPATPVDVANAEQILGAMWVRCCRAAGLEADERQYFAPIAKAESAPSYIARGSSLNDGRKWGIRGLLEAAIGDGPDAEHCLGQILDFAETMYGKKTCFHSASIRLPADVTSIESNLEDASIDRSLQRLRFAPAIAVQNGATARTTAVGAMEGACTREDRAISMPPITEGHANTRITAIRAEIAAMEAQYIGRTMHRHMADTLRELEAEIDTLQPALTHPPGWVNPTKTIRTQFPSRR